jgi:hypothetical protein
LPIFRRSLLEEEDPDERWELYLARQQIGEEGDEEQEEQDQEPTIRMMSQELKSEFSIDRKTEKCWARRMLHDSGANIHAVPTRLVSDLELQVFKLKSPKVIKFGNGTRGTSVYYCHLGSILGKVAIMTISHMRPLLKL